MTYTSKPRSGYVRIEGKSSLPPNKNNLMLGATLIDRYHILRHLSRGGFGQTYVAEDLHLPGKPLCVVKQLKPKESDRVSLEMARRFFDQEAEVLYKLGTHDQIPELLAHFEENQEFYLVQDYIDGDDLSHEITSGKRWSEPQVIDLLRELLEILVFVHQHNVIHRDIKPENLIRRKADQKLFLIDFGAVKQLRVQTVDAQGHTSYTVMIGSQGYMPNEQLAGKPRLSSDIYAVGIIGIQALTGLSISQLKEDAQTGELLWRDMAQVSSQFAEILERMVRYDFRQRYPSANAALQALTACTTATPTVTIAPKTTIVPKTTAIAVPKSPPPRAVAPPASGNAELSHLELPPVHPFDTPSPSARIILQVVLFCLGMAIVFSLATLNRPTKVRQATPTPSPSATIAPDSTAPPDPTQSPSPQPVAPQSPVASPTTIAPVTPLPTLSLIHI
ncbi:protein kinase domain-containing protein, partial [Pantanalinema rosaneae CENA516]|uniref:protein kinase domain-containing protein n=1 Tax=Pantanalinema rosaneae TaxID=1620701 RepID=UPI003D6F4B78